MHRVQPRTVVDDDQGDRVSQVDPRDELLAIERARWPVLVELLDEVPASRREEPSLNEEGWSVRDAVWHLACWNEVVATQLESMHAGTFDGGFDWQQEENNARFLVSGRSISYENARASLEDARTRVVRAMHDLPEVTPRALELFAEPAHQHLDDHLPELRRFLRPSDGTPNEPSR